MDVREKLKEGKSIYEQNLRVCYYARVSTDHELQATSIVNQVDYFIKYIESNSNWKLVGGYVDEGISGKEVRKREKFLQMIQDGKNQKFDLVLTKSVSRFARNTIDSIRYTNLLLEYGVGVMFVNDNINTFYSDSEFRLTLMASIAQDEIRKLSESVQFGLRQSVDRGVVLGNSNILGYVKDKGRLVIVPEEAFVVRDIFSLFGTGNYKYSEVSREIYRMYYKKLDSTGIKRILTNPKYKGYYCGRKSKVIDYKHSRRKWIDRDKWVEYPDYEKVPPIVSEKLWDKVQMIIRDRIENKISKNYLNGAIYNGKVSCSIHGKSVKYKIKCYKDRYYGYFICPKCFCLSDRILDKIYKVSFFEYMEVFPGEEMILKCKCQ